MNDQKRNRIFEVFSTNLSMVAERLGITIQSIDGEIIKEIIDPIYICPLCKQAFFKESLSQELENPLTLEDVPPVSLGGKPLILTCCKQEKEIQ